MRVYLASVVVLLRGRPVRSHKASRCNPGDTIQISVFQDPKLDRQVVVAPDGMISFPLAGHIKAAGITTQSLENLLRARLQKNYTDKLDVTVSLAAVNTDDTLGSRPRVYISGEILKPGPYPLKPPITIAQAISLAGGLKSVRGSPADPGSSQDRRRRYRLGVRLQGIPVRHGAGRELRAASQVTSSLFPNEACLNEMCGRGGLRIRSTVKRVGLHGLVVSGRFRLRGVCG